MISADAKNALLAQTFAQDAVASEELQTAMFEGNGRPPDADVPRPSQVGRASDFRCSVDLRTWPLLPPYPPTAPVRR